MAVQFRRVAPCEVRESVVDFFWRMRTWPYDNKEAYYRYWDWRYDSLSEDEAIVWVAEEAGRVVGHIALHSRRHLMGDRVVRVGVPGNFRVDTEYRDTLVGARLATSPRTLVRDGEIDLLLTYGNRIAHAMFTRMGAHDLGGMMAFIDVRRWDRVVARTLPWATPLAPIASVLARARKAFLRRGAPPPHAWLQARELSFEEALTLDRSHWTAPPDAFVSRGSSNYLAKRFLRCPSRSHHLFAITDRRTGRVEGLVVTEGQSRVKVWLCEVNDSAISETEALDLAFRAMPDAENLVVPLLPDSTLAANLRHAGFLRRPADTVEASSWWSAVWQPSHELAPRFADTKHWKLWFAWNHL